MGGIERTKVESWGGYCKDIKRGGGRASQQGNVGIVRGVGEVEQNEMVAGGDSCVRGVWGGKLVMVVVVAVRRGGGGGEKVLGKEKDEDEGTENGERNIKIWREVKKAIGKVLRRILK